MTTTNTTDFVKRAKSVCAQADRTEQRALAAVHAALITYGNATAASALAYARLERAEEKTAQKVTP